MGHGKKKETRKEGRQATEMRLGNGTGEGGRGGMAETARACGWME